MKLHPFATVQLLLCSPFLMGHGWAPICGLGVGDPCTRGTILAFPQRHSLFPDMALVTTFWRMWWQWIASHWNVWNVCVSSMCLCVLILMLFGDIKQKRLRCLSKLILFSFENLVILNRWPYLLRRLLPNLFLVQVTHPLTPRVSLYLRYPWPLFLV